MSTFEPSFIILFSLLIPLVTVFTAAAVKKPNWRDGCTLFMSSILLLNIINIMSLSANYLKIGRSFPVAKLIEIIPGLPIMFKIEWLGLVFAFVISFLWIVSTIYSIGYMRGNNEKHQNRFFSFFALAIFASLGVAFAGNLFTMFIFYEILTLSTVPLVAHHGNVEAKKAVRVYLGVLLGTSIAFFLPAIIWTYSITGTTEFVRGGILAGHLSPVLMGFLLFLFVYGIGKAALMPIHRWLPAAMVAPTPVSALLHAVAIVKAGVFSIVKIIIYIFGVDTLSSAISQNWFAGGWLTYIAGITIISASLVALKQNNLKKMLAYSTISQLSYIILAASLLVPKALTAAIFHIVAHAFGKITLFFAAGAIYTASHKKNIGEMHGIGKSMPITMGAFTVAALSMIGIPPAVGFLTKYYILVGAFEVQHYFAISVIIISTILNSAYFLPIIYNAFFRNGSNTATHGEAPLPILIAMTITAIMVIGLFLFPDLFLWLGAQAAK